MASVFLSYDREDTDKARPIATTMEKAGHSVWWDRHIRGGAQYSKEIERALKDSDAVVVLWSERSVESPWVRDEAATGRDSGRLVPVRLDSVEPPLGFRQYQAIDLSGWSGRRRRLPKTGELLQAIDALSPPRVSEGEETPAPAKAPLSVGSAENRRGFPRAVIAAAVALFSILAAGLLIWQPWRQGLAAPVVAVTPADRSSTAAAFARDLLVNLGTLQASNAGALQLVGPDSQAEPDFIFQVSGSTQDQIVGANLALLQGKNRILLWSRSFEQPRDQQADLKQQLAYSAAQVLQCAAQATEFGGQSLRPQTHKLYLNGCAEFAAAIGSDDQAVVPIFVRVVEDAPGFRDAWAKLLIAKSNLVAAASLAGTQVNSEDESLRRLAEQARERFADMPEVYLAQLVLLPTKSHAQRLKLADQAKELGPDNPFVLVYRALELSLVGRMNEAVADMARAAELDPLSPAIRNAYISTLGYAGRTAMAEEALEHAERLWAGAMSVSDASFQYHLHFGNPSQALALLRSGVVGTGRAHEALEAFLEARIEPSEVNVDRAVQTARSVAERYENLGFLMQALGEFGREDQLYDTMQRWTGLRSAGDARLLFRPALHQFRKEPRFMRVTAQFSLLDYWRSSGHWPDFCFEPDLPYDCKAEAAKVTA